ncbi:protein encoded within IS [Shigella boydii]|nr:protein encoded within IS [Shigella boydii]
MNQKYLIRIAELECQLRQKDQQLSLVEETEAFLRSALARAEEKIEEDEREIEHLRAQIEKLRRMLFGTRSEKLRREVCRQGLQALLRNFTTQFSERVPNSIRRSFSI